MTIYYHPSRVAALAAAIEFETNFTARASFEPDNGWVLVLTPREPGYLLSIPNLDDILDFAEIDLTATPVLRRTPRTKVKATRQDTRRPDTKASTAGAWVPGTPLPW